jgi:hypothetical protein
LKAAGKIISDPVDITCTSIGFNTEFVPHGEMEEEQTASICKLNNLITREAHLRKLSVIGS